jgi:predicted ATPase
MLPLLSGSCPYSSTGGVSDLDTVILNPEDLQLVKATHVQIWNTTLREYHAACEYAATAVTLARTQGFPHLEAVGSVLQGGTLTTLGDATIGIRRICEGLTACQTTGAILARPYLLALLAEAHACAGQHDEARDVLNDALAVADSTGEQ